MSNPPDAPPAESESESDENLPEPLHCTKLLLACIQESKEEGWLLQEEWMHKSLDLFAQEFDGPNMGAAVDQFMNVVGAVYFEIGRADLAQRLLDEMESRVTDGHVNRVKAALEERIADQSDEARAQFSKLLGPEPQLEQAQPREKIDFQIPKGSVKG